MKNVLIISVGLSPQVVTETVYALVCESGVSVDEVHLWTTTDGARAIERTLLDGGKGALYRLFADYGLKHAVVYTRVFGKVKDAPSYLGLSLDRPLEDIRSLADNQLVADTLMHFIQEQAADPSRRLLCCLAGARKTIGVYLALALQFFGGKATGSFTCSCGLSWKTIHPSLSAAARSRRDRTCRSSHSLLARVFQCASNAQRAPKLQ